jgi:hypothetical protein
VADVVRVQPPTDEELQEQWTRTGPDAKLTSVEAGLLPDHPWQVIVSMADLVRTGPLASRLEEAVTLALQAVPGVTQVAREDTEVWLAWGAPAGDELVRAVAVVVDALVVPAQTQLARERGSTPEAPRPVDRKALAWAGVLTLVGMGLLVAGLSSSDVGTIALGAVTVLFFGGGGLALILLGRRPPRATGRGTL